MVRKINQKLIEQRMCENEFRRSFIFDQGKGELEQYLINGMVMGQKSIAQKMYKTETENKELGRSFNGG